MMGISVLNRHFEKCTILLGDDHFRISEGGVLTMCNSNKRF